MNAGDEGYLRNGWCGKWLGNVWGREMIGAGNGLVREEDVLYWCEQIIPQSHGQDRKVHAVPLEWEQELHEGFRDVSQEGPRRRTEDDLSLSDHGRVDEDDGAHVQHAEEQAEARVQEGRLVRRGTCEGCDRLPEGVAHACLALGRDGDLCVCVCLFVYLCLYLRLSVFLCVFLTFNSPYA